MNSQTRALGMFSSDYAKTNFTITSPRLKAPMTVTCEGGQNRLGMGWIDFKRNDLAYVCNFVGGPSDASFALVLSDGKFLDKLYQPQRAAEIRYGGVTLRAKTRKMPGSMPLGGGATPSYVILKDDQEVGAWSAHPSRGRSICRSRAHPTAMRRRPWPWPCSSSPIRAPRRDRD
uniref:Uncharacterized protein n=1 Tax=Phenylobacterium glaciei TaxID=2803784 RepID=A0A974S929_9CAUL|nr:hypothetical protein JKL49_00345 [Phenylobacterium glaciei]